MKHYCFCFKNINRLLVQKLIRSTQNNSGIIKFQIMKTAKYTTHPNNQKNITHLQATTPHHRLSLQIHQQSNTNQCRSQVPQSIHDCLQNNNQQDEQSFLSEREFCICPQFYSLWRNEKLVKELSLGEGVVLRVYSQGRREIRHGDGILQAIYNDIRLIRFPNGDFKLIEGDKVSYWNNQINEIDKFYLC